MQEILVSHGGILGVLAVVILLLVKEVIANGNGKYITTKFCNERHQHIVDSLARLEEKAEKNEEKIDYNREIVLRELSGLPEKINGPQRKG